MNTTALPGRTDELLDAQTTAIAFIREHGLYADSIDLRLGSTTARRWNRETQDFDRPCMPIRATVCMFRHPEEFLRWADALPPADVLVKRRDGDTCLNLYSDHANITWEIASGISRPETGPHLPGIPAPWTRNRRRALTDHGRISAEQLRTVLATLGGAS
jgi:hypothetical protein